jgi:putative exporter of polyketide antibiotics
VTIVVGLAFVLAGIAVDDGPSRPYGFWLHVAAGVLIGGSLIFLLHHGTFEWTLIAIASVAYVGLAELFARSSWAVLGALGLLIVAGQFSLEWTHIRVSLFEPQGAGGRGWVPPLVFGGAGVLLVLLGLLAARRRERLSAV